MWSDLRALLTYCSLPCALDSAHGYVSKDLVAMIVGATTHEGKAQLDGYGGSAVLADFSVVGEEMV
jgi:hypothetical protein